MIKIVCLDDNREFFFDADTSYEAMKKLIYYLNLSHKDDSAKVMLCNGRTLEVVHNGKTYGCLM